MRMAKRLLLTAALGIFAMATPALAIHNGYGGGSNANTANIGTCATASPHMLNRSDFSASDNIYGGGSNGLGEQLPTLANSVTPRQNINKLATGGSNALGENPTIVTCSAQMNRPMMNGRW